MIKKEFYQTILELIYAGSYDQASGEIRQLREKNSQMWNSELALMQNLLAARLALKSGNIPDSVDTLTISVETDNFLAGEVFMVKGITRYQSGKMIEGMSDYLIAKKYFEKSGHKDKELMAWYNHLIGSTHVSDRSLHDYLQMFRSIEAEAEKYLQNRILGLVRRQKSYFYKDHKKFHAALHEAERSIPYLELHCAASDYHLGLVNIAEILLELQQKKDAQKYYEMIVQPLDKRVQFPFAFIEARLFDGKVDTTNMTQSCPHFVHRYEIWKSAIRSINKIENKLVLINKDDNVQIQFNGKVLSIKKNVLEFKLIEILASGPHSKNLICEKLWPEYSEVHHLDNRLHRLISRVNKKIDGLILYSDKSYKLSGTA